MTRLELIESLPVPCFISEYTMPEGRFVPIWTKSSVRKFSSVRANICNEMVYVPKRWAHLKGSVYFNSDELFA